MEFIVEVSHSYAADDSQDVRFVVGTVEALAQRIESEMDCYAGHAAEIAAEVAGGEPLNYEDTETGRIVTARVAELVA